nr:hypothetical protein [Paenibacillus jamilae]
MNGLHYTVRSAIDKDASDLSELRLQINGETENLDREQGEAFIDTSRFKQIIQMDAVKPRNLFLVAVKDKILTDGKYHNTVIMGRFNE